MKFLGDKLRRLRRAKEWTLDDVGEMTGLKSGHISDIEHGLTNPRPNTLKKLCEGQGIDEAYFYTAG